MELTSVEGTRPDLDQGVIVRIGLALRRGTQPIIMQRHRWVHCHSLPLSTSGWLQTLQQSA